MDRPKGYNGWTNYETWSVALLIDNDEASQNYWTAMAAECFEEAAEDGTFTRREAAALELCARLRDEHETAMPDLGCTIYAQLLEAAMSEINWFELADHYLENALDDDGVPQAKDVAP